jgi:hypothetical protein
MSKKHDTVEFNIPFAGFYCSNYDSLLDSELEQYIYNRANESDYESDESAFPKALRLDESELGNLTWRHANWSIAHDTIAKDYAEQFGQIIADEFSTRDNPLSYSLMTSPREYNFETDRLFADLPLAIAYLMFRESRNEGHETLARMIKERFTSCSGFISHYSNSLANWLATPLADWDHNELGTLLLAWLEIRRVDWEESLFYSIAESGYQYFDSCFDFAGFDSDVTEARAEKLADWLSTDFDSAVAWRAYNRDLFDSIMKADSGLFQDWDEFAEGLPYRCENTPDMFN